MSSTLSAGWKEDKLQEAAAMLSAAVDQDRIHAACLLVRQGDHSYTRSFGAADSIEAIFLLASISKPISVAALMTLYDQGMFQLDDPVSRFVPEFKGDDRQRVTIRHLLTHTSGLPDQLPENRALRSQQAGLEQFVMGAVRTPLHFVPGSRYSYSSMGILLAAEAASRISGTRFDALVHETVLRPLGMNRSALGLGEFRMDDVVRCQVQHAAPESGQGDEAAEHWDWNSSYWRRLGAPWGGAHGSAPDVAKFLAEFLRPTEKIVKPATARLMCSNHNPTLAVPRGLGFALGKRLAGDHCSEQTFGHGGSTGTLTWADPVTDTICVVLTTLPLGAADPHPRTLASNLVARATSNR